MEISVREIVRRRGAAIAAVVAIGLAVLLVVQQYLEAFVVYLVTLPNLAAGYDWNDFAPSGLRLALTLLPLAIGVFLSLWLLAPIAAELRMGHAIARAILAVGIGCTLGFIALAVVAIVGSVSITGALFGQSFPTPVVNGSSIAMGLGSALASAAIQFIEVAPLGVLGGVLAWNWLTRHPAKHPVSGMLDEV
jgi:hypothetical protein